MLKRFEICSKLTIKTPERRHWRHSDVFNVNFGYISHLFLVFLHGKLFAYAHSESAPFGSAADEFIYLFKLFVSFLRNFAE